MHFTRDNHGLITIPQPITYDELLHITQTVIAEKLHREVNITSPEDAGAYFQARLMNRMTEAFAACWLDCRHGVIALEILFEGTVDGASVHPREVVRRALHHNAVAVIFAHNHPSGGAEPSGADRSITKNLKDALSLVGVRILDHMVVGTTVVSMAARGLI